MAKINHYTVPIAIHRMFSLLILVLGLVVVCCGCGKDKVTKAELPPATQEGKNTVGFTLNEEVWLPYYRCGIGSDPCGEISANYSLPYAAPNGISFQVARRQADKSSSLTVTSSGIGTITTPGDKIDSLSITYRPEEWVSGNSGIYRGPLSGSKFVITKIDHQNQVISGEFVFILREQNGSGKEITLKDGRFDFKFNACKCSTE